MNAKVGIDASKPASPTMKRMKTIEMPSVQANERTTLASRTSGATIACSRIAEDDRHHQQRQRHDQLQVPLGRLVEVVVDRRPAAHERGHPGSRFATAVAHLGHEVERGDVVRVALQDRVDLSDLAVGRFLRRWVAAAATPLTVFSFVGRQLQRPAAVTGPLSLHQHRRRRERPGREVLTQHLEALDALHRLLEEGGARVVDLVGDQARARRAGRRRP